MFSKTIAAILFLSLACSCDANADKKLMRREGMLLEKEVEENGANAAASAEGTSAVQIDVAGQLAKENKATGEMLENEEQEEEEKEARSRIVVPQTCGIAVFDDFWPEDEKDACAACAAAAAKLVRCANALDAVNGNSNAEVPFSGECSDYSGGGGGSSTTYPSSAYSSTATTTSYLMQTEVDINMTLAASNSTYATSLVNDECKGWDKDLDAGQGAFMLLILAGAGSNMVGPALACSNHTDSTEYDVISSAINDENSDAYIPPPDTNTTFPGCAAVAPGGAAGSSTVALSQRSPALTQQGAARQIRQAPTSAPNRVCTQGCINPATDPPGGWACRCTSALQQACAATDDEALCVKKVYCGEDRIHEAWKEINCVAPQALVDARTTGCGSLLVERTKRANPTKSRMRREKDNGVSLDESLSGKRCANPPCRTCC